MKVVVIELDPESKLYLIIHSESPLFRSDLKWINIQVMKAQVGKVRESCSRMSTGTPWAASPLHHWLNKSFYWLHYSSPKWITFFRQNVYCLWEGTSNIITDLRIHAGHKVGLWFYYVWPSGVQLGCSSSGPLSSPLTTGGLPVWSLGYSWLKCRGVGDTQPLTAPSEPVSAF